MFLKILVCQFNIFLSLFQIIKNNKKIIRNIISDADNDIVIILVRVGIVLAICSCLTIFYMVVSKKIHFILDQQNHVFLFLTYINFYALTFFLENQCALSWHVYSLSERVLNLKLHRVRTRKIVDISLYKMPEYPKRYFVVHDVVSSKLKSTIHNRNTFS